MSEVLLVRHPPVARAWAGRCYGASDMGWSREGAAMARILADRLAGERPAAIVHSGLRRTHRLAAMLAARTAAPLVADAGWRERDFGGWEGRAWQAIWRETGDLMDRMMTDPERFRPGDTGETGADLAERALAAWAALPAGRVVVVAHGGPIAALLAHRAGAPLARTIDHVPACGAVVRVPRP